MDISPTSSAERVTQTQLDLTLLNNPIHVMTPEQFVDDALGIQDATGHMKEVDAYYAITPFMQGLTDQTLSTYYGSKVLVGADGVMANGLGQKVDPTQALAMNGVTPVQSDATAPDAGGAPGMMSPSLPDLPSQPGTAVLPAAPGMAG